MKNTNRVSGARAPVAIVLCYAHTAPFDFLRVLTKPVSFQVLVMTANAFELQSPVGENLNIREQFADAQPLGLG